MFNALTVFIQNSKNVYLRRTLEYNYFFISDLSLFYLAV